RSRVLIQIDRDPLPIAVRSEVSGHHAHPAHLALDVDIPGLHPGWEPVGIRETRRETDRARLRIGRVELDVARCRSIRLRGERGDERGIAGLACEIPCVRLVDHDRVRAANSELAVAGWIPDHARARLEVAAVLGHPGETAGPTDLHQ